MALYDDKPSLQDRTVGDRHRFAPIWRDAMRRGGYVGRASGRDFDARRDVALSAL